MASHSQTVLLLEPDPDVRSALELWLSQQGLSVRTDSQFSPQHGEDKPDIVISESSRIGIPPSELLEFFSQRNVPVIFMGHDRAVQMAVDLLRAGAVDFLEKPFAQSRLHFSLNQLDS